MRPPISPLPSPISTTARRCHHLFSTSHPNFPITEGEARTSLLSSPPELLFLPPWKSLRRLRPQPVLLWFSPATQISPLPKEKLALHYFPRRRSCCSCRRGSHRAASVLNQCYCGSTQVSELKKKQVAKAQLLRQKQKSDGAAKQLRDEIHRIKSQKVQTAEDS
ncbi:hypothetical protein PIB30_025020 [Stylosanthes scabra]|uniref:Uncharacterized protein n=1 Tax=Stylosanthes scabra TaxID=79078 RepID=A0ABU6QA50_9FABA|nr:hypothetical protein [Stylosanthes scabra]